MVVKLCEEEVYGEEFVGKVFCGMGQGEEEAVPGRGMQKGRSLLSWF
jgi:hypothetical protein